MKETILGLLGLALSAREGMVGLWHFQAIGRTRFLRLINVKQPQIHQTLVFMGTWSILLGLYLGKATPNPGHADLVIWAGFVPAFTVAFWSVWRNRGLGRRRLWMTAIVGEVAILSYLIIDAVRNL